MREPGDDTEDVVRELKDAMRVRWTHHRWRNAPVAEGDARESTWLELVETLSRFRRTKAKEDAGAWSPATYLTRAEVEAVAKCCPAAHKLDTHCRLRKDGAVARKAVNVRDVSCLVVDVDDGGKPALDAILERLSKRGVRHWWHTTHTSADRFRIIVPLSKPVPAEKWWDIWHWGLKALGAKASADASCKDASRLYYLPATALERVDDGFCGGARAGRGLEVEALYALGPWPEQPRRAGEAAPKVYPAASETQLWAAAQALEKFGDAVEGQHGDSRTFTAAAILTNDWALTAEEAWPILQGWNVRHAKPPWSDEELQEKLENSGAYAQGAYGAAREAKTPYQLEVARVEAELELRLGSSTPRAEPARWTSAAELLGTDFPAADWLIQGLLAKDTLTIIGADPKASKTWTLIELAIAIGTGGAAFGVFPARTEAPVLLFLNEDSARSVRNRFRALAAGHGLAPERLHRVAVRTREALDLCDKTQLAQLIVDIRMAPEKPALVGLDPLRNLHSAEENSSTEMRQVLRALGAIRELCGCALAVVHHSAKARESDNRTAGARMRGSSAIDGYRDGLISLEETTKGEDGDRIANKVVVDLKAFRGAGMFALELFLEDDAEGEAIRATWAKSEVQPKMAPAKAADGEPRLTKREEVAFAILTYLRELHGIAQKTSKQEVWVTQATAVKEVCALTGATEQTVIRALAWLVEQKKLVKEPVPTSDTRGRAKGIKARWQYRLADDATEPPEDLQ